MQLTPRQQWVRDQWNAGNSAGVIQKMLKEQGERTSRNAIIGMVRRMRLAGVEIAERKMAPIMLPPLPRAQWEKTGGVYRRKPTIQEKIDASPLPIPKNLSILELRHHHCRAITGTDAKGMALYCGHTRRAHGKFAFCEAHAARYLITWEELCRTLKSKH